MNTADDDMSEADRGWDDDDDGMVDYTDEPGSGGNPSTRKAGPDDDVYVDYTGESDTGEVWDDGGDLLDRAEEPDAAGNTSKRRPRKRRRPSRTEEGLFKRWRENFERQNKKDFRRALSCPYTIHNLDVLSLLTPDQKHRNKTEIPDDSGSYGRMKWTGDQPALWVDCNGVPVVLIIPEWLKENSKKSLFDTLMRFGRSVRVAIPKGAGKKAQLDSTYPRRQFDREIHGVFQLASLCKATGRGQDTQAGTSPDVLKTLPQSMELLHDIRMLSARLDHLLSVLDPGQHEHFCHVSALLKETNIIYKTLSSVDSSFFHGRSIIYNKDMKEHLEKDKKMAWIPILSVGRYTTGTFKVLGRDIDYRPGTLVCIRGAVLPHEIESSGGQRIDLVHVMQSDIVDEVCPDPLPIEKVSEIQKRMQEEEEARVAKRPRRPVDAPSPRDATLKSGMPWFREAGMVPYDL